jgi:hypothetical protein
MPDTNKNLLTNELENNEMLCLGLKALIDGGGSRKSLSTVVEELCNSSESLKNKYGTFN